MIEYNNLLKHLGRKLYIIPLAFVLLRIWGTIQFLLSVAVFANDGGLIDETGCVSTTVYYTYFVLACLQVLY